MHFDTTGVWDGDLLQVTLNGRILRVNADGNATQIASVRGPAEGIWAVPDDEEMFGPLAGTVLVTNERTGEIFAAEPDGNVSTWKFTAPGIESVAICPDPPTDFFVITSISSGLKSLTS